MKTRGLPSQLLTSPLLLILSLDDHPFRTHYSAVFRSNSHEVGSILQHYQWTTTTHIWKSCSWRLVRGIRSVLLTYLYVGRIPAEIGPGLRDHRHVASTES
ncbi:hypothetical protein BDV28DRAFT_130682 [Aspergillus coremiiformis]|uniref:Uncharacterized protein n=1 Tax=Aspergillus coremiiformis TaxID=138285 RepID=A0A5N6ZAC0_9EURO|nr:hypothetical protein BDV28DRAFT_130682 [Aspergillus coremiiformis]